MATSVWKNFTDFINPFRDFNYARMLKQAKEPYKNQWHDFYALWLGSPGKSIAAWLIGFRWGLSDWVSMGLFPLFAVLITAIAAVAVLVLAPVALVLWAAASLWNKNSKPMKIFLSVLSAAAIILLGIPGVVIALPVAAVAGIAFGLWLSAKVLTSALCAAFFFPVKLGVDSFLNSKAQDYQQKLSQLDPKNPSRLKQLLDAGEVASIDLTYNRDEKALVLTSSYVALINAEIINTIPSRYNVHDTVILHLSLAELNADTKHKICLALTALMVLNTRIERHLENIFNATQLKRTQDKVAFTYENLFMALQIKDGPLEQTKVVIEEFDTEYNKLPEEASEDFEMTAGEQTEVLSEESDAESDYEIESKYIKQS